MEDHGIKVGNVEITLDNGGFNVVSHGIKVGNVELTVGLKWLNFR